MDGTVARGDQAVTGSQEVEGAQEVEGIGGVTGGRPPHLQAVQRTLQSGRLPHPAQSDLGGRSLLKTSGIQQ